MKHFLTKIGWCSGDWVSISGESRPKISVQSQPAQAIAEFW